MQKAWPLSLINFFTYRSLPPLLCSFSLYLQLFSSRMSVSLVGIQYRHGPLICLLTLLPVISTHFWILFHIDITQTTFVCYSVNELMISNICKLFCAISRLFYAHYKPMNRVRSSSLDRRPLASWVLTLKVGGLMTYVWLLILNELKSEQNLADHVVQGPHW